jgi:hypothetical protein
MKYPIVLFFAIITFSIVTQEHFDEAKKGLKHVTNISQTSSGSIYAVVVGISDYQDEDIPDLRFADKDALAFAGYLQSPSGRSLDEDHLKVMITFLKGESFCFKSSKDLIIMNY